jgi:hypothetical protein
MDFRSEPAEALSLSVSSGECREGEREGAREGAKSAAADVLAGRRGSEALIGWVRAQGGGVRKGGREEVAGLK